MPGQELLARARGVRFMGFDVDGVLTDGALFLTDGGEELKAFHTLDGLGLKLLAQAGIAVALITGRQSRTVALRAADLGIERLLQGVTDKLAVLETLRAELGLAMDQCGYMGDDLPDLALLSRCGFAATVPGAPAYVRERVHYVTSAQAGHGAVREVCDLVLRARGELDSTVASYL